MLILLSHEYITCSIDTYLVLSSITFWVSNKVNCLPILIMRIDARTLSIYSHIVILYLLLILIQFCHPWLLKLLRLHISYLCYSFEVDFKFLNSTSTQIHHELLQILIQYHHLQMQVALYSLSSELDTEGHFYSLLISLYTFHPSLVSSWNLFRHIGNII